MTFSKIRKSRKIKRGGDGSRTSSRSRTRSRSRRSRRSSSSIIKSLNSLNRTQQVDTTSLRERISENQSFYRLFLLELGSEEKMTVDDLLKKIKKVANQVYKDEFNTAQIDEFTKFKYDELSQLFI
jgi:hypothetical protein